MSRTQEQPLDRRFLGIRSHVIVFLCAWMISIGLFYLLTTAGNRWILQYFAGLPQTGILRARSALERKDYQLLESEVRGILKGNPNDFDARFLLADSLRNRGLRARAYEELREAERQLRMVAAGNLHGLRGMDQGKIYESMGIMDFESGRFEQGAANLLRVIDERRDIVGVGPPGLDSVQQFIEKRVKGSPSRAEWLALCRLLDATGSQIDARMILGKMAEADPALSFEPRLVEAELNLLVAPRTLTENELRVVTQAAKKTIDGVLASPDTPYFGRVWANLLLGQDDAPGEPITDESLDRLLGGKPTKILRLRSEAMRNELELPPDAAIRYSFTLDSPARAFWVIARGTSAMGTWPYVIVRLDGTEVARLYIRLWACHPYVVPVSAEEGRHTIELELTNSERDDAWKAETSAYVRAIVWMP